MRSNHEKLLNAVERADVYREVVITSAGVPIVLSVWPGSPTAPALVFLPGTMTHPLFYEDFLNRLNEAGVTVVGVHSQGHGKSPRVHRRLTFDVLVENARDACAWTWAAFPDRPVVVLGSSQGGILAMALAGTGAPLDAVFAHNVLDPSLPASIAITRFPAGFAKAYPLVTSALRLAGRLMPRVPVPFDAYLDIHRVCRDPQNVDLFYTDPLGLRSYPLAYMASLFTADLTGMTDGSISCPVTVLAARGDPLFPLRYTEQVFQRIVAPTKELVVIDSEVHLLFNEDIDRVLPPLLQRLDLVERTRPASTVRPLAGASYPSTTSSTVVAGS